MGRSEKQKIDEIASGGRAEVPVAEASETGAGQPKKRKWWVIAAFSILFVLFAGAVGAAIYFYLQTKQAPAVGAVAEVKEAEQIREEIGRLMELPAEVPTLATVTDKSKLASQPFFQKAENGDKILFFTGEKKAILYRPSTKKIVDVTTINISDNKAVAQPATETAALAEADAAKEAPVTVTAALYNGSAKIGVTNKLEDEVVAAFPEVVVEKKEKAAKDDYTGNLVIDLSGKQAELAKKLADSIAGTLADALPDGEINPGTDLLVIVGNK